MTDTLETPRLFLRTIQPQDLNAFFPIFADERAMRFMPTPPHASADETLAWLGGEASRPGAHFWTIRFRDSEEPIGYVNYLGQTRFPGMGYMVNPNHWGQGIAPEACRAALDFGFEQLGYGRVELWIDETNTRSIRVAQKLGFQPKGRIPLKYPHRDNHHFMLVYGILADQWKAEVGPPERGVSAGGGTAADHETHFFGVEPVLRVPDVPATVLYYREKLGFGVEFIYGDPPEHAGVSRGEWTGSTVTLQFSQFQPEQELAPSGYLYVNVDTRIDALCDIYRKRGVEILSDPEDKPWGMREFTMRDLNGYILVFGTQR